MASDPFPDRPPDGARVPVVATRPETFERCRRGFYPCPRSYDRTRRAFEWMAFYRTAPVSAITHYARVTGRHEQRRPDAGGGDGDGDGIMDADDWEALIEPFSGEEVAVVFRLSELVALDRPVENDANGVRGAWYVTAGDLRAAGTVSGLAARTGGGDDA